MRATLDRRKTEPVLELAVDWAPAYELLVSFMTFAERDKHCLDELGPRWVATARQRLPTGFAPQQVCSKSSHDEELLARLVRGCPVERDAASWLDWLGQLGAGAAYEIMAELAPDDGRHMPRDFTAWRDRFVELLRTWYDGYFAQLDPAILDGLQAEADALRARLGSLPPRELVEQVTNGIWVEPSPEVRRVELVPQYHQRPYNDDCGLAGGILIMYPADSVVSPTDDGPPIGLLRLTRGLSDESRLRILRYLAQGSKTLTEVARFAGLKQPTVHYHLAQLRAAGLVRVHFSRASSSRRYSLRPHALDQLTRQLATYLEVPPL